MPQAKNIIYSLCFLLLLSGCSSWELKERCEKTNWFEYARDVANSGRYLEEDGFIKECKKVDRISDQQIDIGFKSGRERYCTYESFLRNGEAGEPVNFKMCDNLVLKDMQMRYAQGLKSYCTSKTGYTVGASGKVYKNVCLKKSEEDFLPPYFKGRKEFLTKQIEQLTQDIASLQNLQSDLSRQIQLISNEIFMLPKNVTCHTEHYVDANTQKEEVRNICQEDPVTAMRRSYLNQQIDPLRSQYAQHGFILAKETKTLIEARSELTKIPAGI